jgi:hypothetical protein
LWRWRPRWPVPSGGGERMDELWVEFFDLLWWVRR